MPYDVPWGSTVAVGNRTPPPSAAQREEIGTSKTRPEQLVGGMVGKNGAGSGAIVC